MFHQVQTWHAIRAMCADSSLKEGHVYNHAICNIANQIHGFVID